MEDYEQVICRKNVMDTHNGSTTKYALYECREHGRTVYRWYARKFYGHASQTYMIIETDLKMSANSKRKAVALFNRTYGRGQRWVITNTPLNPESRKV